MKKTRAPFISRESVTSTFLEILAETQDSSKVNFREIARRLGCNHTNLYNYFGNFEELRLAALEWLQARIKGKLTTDERDESPEIRLKTISANTIRFALNNPGIYRFLWVDTLTNEGSREALSRLTRPGLLIEPILQQMDSRGHSHQFLSQIAGILHSYVHGEILKSICGRSWLLGEEAAEVISKQAVALARALLEECSDSREAGRSPKLDT